MSYTKSRLSSDFFVAPRHNFFSISSKNKEIDHSQGVTEVGEELPALANGLEASVGSPEIEAYHRLADH